MTFLGTKHSKPQQRGVLSALQDDQPVSAPRAGLHVPCSICRTCGWHQKTLLFSKSDVKA